MEIDCLKSKIESYSPMLVSKLPKTKLASVFVLFYEINNQMNLVLQVRSQKLKHHPGEIGFPGGSLEKSDQNLYQTATREVQEEIGVPFSDIELFGKLDPVLTSTQFLIHPYVGKIINKQKFSLSCEVQSMLFVPVSELNNQINWRNDYIINKNCIKNNKAFYYDGNIIFGATAKIINNLLNLLDENV